MKKLVNIYCDMDGVLADFGAERNAVERFAVEKGFFQILKPMERNVKALKKLVKANGVRVFILSASPNEQADQDKKVWLEKYLPEIAKENIIIMRNGMKKVDYMKTEKGILLDDYGVNIQEWLEKRENRALKIKGDGDIEKVVLELAR